MNKPNILIFIPDQMRADALHHLGNEASYTPCMDSMLKDSVSFRNAFAQNPVCNPSRCSFLTGWYPHVRGHRTMTYLIHPDEPMLLKELKNAGYHVWINERGDIVPADSPDPYADYASTVFKIEGNLDTQTGAEPRGKPGGDNYYSFYSGIIPTEEGKDDIFDVDAAWVRCDRNEIRDATLVSGNCGCVPFKEDQRIPDSMLLRMMESKIPREQFLMVKAALEKGISLSQLMRSAGV